MEYEVKDDNIIVKISNEKGTGSATCYFKNTPKVEGKIVGAIGEFEASNLEIGLELLKNCEAILKEKGCNLIVGPMNQNTWHKYRALTYTTDEPKFILENVNPIEDTEIFEKAGFNQEYIYTSTKGKIEDYEKPKFESFIAEKIKKQNITIRSFNKQNYIEDLKKIYSVALPSFYKNPFYTPISEEDFLKQYEPYISMFDEDLILIAEKDSIPVGFIFALPNYDKKTLVLKTVAVLKEYQKYALGNYIFFKLHKIALEKGYENWIFAFMYNANPSQKSAKRQSTKLIRKYGLFTKEI